MSNLGGSPNQLQVNTLAGSVLVGLTTNKIFMDGLRDMMNIAIKDAIPMLSVSSGGTGHTGPRGFTGPRYLCI